MKNLKKPISLFLVLLLMLSVFSFSAMADGESPNGEYSLFLYSQYSVELSVEIDEDVLEPSVTVDDTSVLSATISETNRTVEGGSTFVNYKLSVSGLSVGRTLVHLDGGSFKDYKLGFTVLSPEESTFSIDDGEKGTVTLSLPKDILYIKYTAKSSGTLKFNSQSGVKLSRFVLDSGLNTLEKGDDSDAGPGFITIKVEAGKLYYIGIYTNDNISSSIVINVFADFMSDTIAEPDTKPDTLPDLIYPTQPTTAQPSGATQPSADANTKTNTDTKQNPDVKTSDNASADNSAKTVTKVIKLKSSPVVFVKSKTIKAKKLSAKKIKFKAVSAKNAGKIKASLVKKGTSKKLRNKVKVSKNGVITLKKGKYKKGKYKVKLKISATASLNTLTRTVIIRIK